MRFIPTRIHGYMDYSVALILILTPIVGGFSFRGPEAWVPILLGVGAIVYSLCTDYECGVAGLLPMPVHLMLDAGSGVLLAASPWLLGFADRVWAPHVILGLVEIGAAAFTQTVPASRPGRGAPRLGS